MCKPVAAEERVERGQGEVAQVLMVDGVELVPLHEVAHVGHFEDGLAVVGEKEREAFEEAVRVGRVGEHVVGDHEVGARALGHQGLGEIAGEELAPRLHANPLGGAGGTGRRVDTEHGDAALCEVAEEVAVIARQLDHQAIRTEAA